MNGTNNTTTTATVRALARRVQRRKSATARECELAAAVLASSRWNSGYDALLASEERRKARR